MTTEDRNYLFEEKAYLVNATMNRYNTLVRACHMEDEDVYQQLSLRLLCAIGEYDPAAYPEWDAYLTGQLYDELLNMKAREGFSLVSLRATGSAGCRTQKTNCCELSNVTWLEQEIDSPPVSQKSILSRLLSGEISTTNKVLRAVRLRISKRLEFSGRLQCA